MPLSPKRTVTGPETLAPSFGLTMYTSAPAGEGVRSWAQATEAARARQAKTTLFAGRARATAIIRMATFSIELTGGPLFAHGPRVAA